MAWLLQMPSCQQMCWRAAMTSHDEGGIVQRAVPRTLPMRFHTDVPAMSQSPKSALFLY
jgi:hypothetical protein